MPKIVLSYRRANSLAMAGRVRDRLAQHYGAKAIFRDLESIPIAEKFPEYIKGVIAEGDVVLSLVGPDWTGGAGERARINDSDDPVRFEIETTLDARASHHSGPDRLKHDAELREQLPRG